MAWAYYYLKQYDKCQKLVHVIEKIDDNLFYGMCAKLLIMYLNNDDSYKKVELLNNLVQHSMDTESFGDVLWSLKLLISEYKKIDDFKNVARCQSIILKSLGYSSFLE